MRKIVFILGDMLSGKTSTCKSLYSRLNDLSMKPYALVEESERNNAGIPMKLSLHELNSGRIFLLGTRDPPDELAREDPGEPPLAPSKENYGPFKFSAEVFEEAEYRLESAWHDGFCPIILDEVGPLEVLVQAGFWKWLALALSREHCFLVVTMRPGLIGIFMDLMNANIPDARKIAARSFSLVALNPEKMLEALSKEILRHCHE